tara:strand:+ start:664 stop:786 length:123 start_codon:yes stop_codon:yes gene_type:complete
MGTTGRKDMSTTPTLSIPWPSTGIDLIISATNGEEAENTQ